MITDCSLCVNLEKGIRGRQYSCKYRRTQFTDVSFKGKCDYFIHKGDEDR